MGEREILEKDESPLLFILSFYLYKMLDLLKSNISVLKSVIQ